MEKKMKVRLNEVSFEKQNVMTSEIEGKRRIENKETEIEVRDIEIQRLKRRL